MQRLLSSGLVGNIVWVAVSMLLATGVWYVAVTSSDPITRRQFPSIPVQIVQDESVISI